MNKDERMRKILGQIAELENDLRKILHEHEVTIFYKVEGERVRFEENLRAAHLKLKQNWFRWIITDRPQNLITGPIIYGLALPFFLFDLSLTLYQSLCFPIYRIEKVRRTDYMIFDRQHLGYLNFFERLHCTYCAYANGLLGFATEIAARTEQYFCPIKHARKIIGRHARYDTFMAYGDAEGYHSKLDKYRTSMAKISEK